MRIEWKHSVYAGEEKQTRGEVENPCRRNPKPHSPTLGPHSNCCGHTQPLQEEEHCLVALDATERSGKHIFMDKCRHRECHQRGAHGGSEPSHSLKDIFIHELLGRPIVTAPKLSRSGRQQRRLHEFACPPAAQPPERGRQSARRNERDENRDGLATLLHDKRHFCPISMKEPDHEYHRQCCSPYCMTELKKVLADRWLRLRAEPSPHH